MKRYHRFLIGIYSLLMAALALLIVLVALGWQLPMDVFENVLAQRDSRLILGVLGVLVFILTMKLFFDSLRKETSDQVLVKTTQTGEIYITKDAVEKMITKSLQSIDGIIEVNPKVKSIKEGIAVLLKVQLISETNIPETTDEIQQTVKEYLETHTGIKLLEAKILVEETAPGTKTRVN